MIFAKKESGVTGILPRRFRMSFPENPLESIFLLISTNQDTAPALTNPMMHVTTINKNLLPPGYMLRSRSGYGLPLSY
jgi:hypothetical protein